MSIFRRNKKCKHGDIRVLAYYKSGTASKARCNGCGELLTAKPAKIDWKIIEFDV